MYYLMFQMAYTTTSGGKCGHECSQDRLTSTLTLHTPHLLTIAKLRGRGGEGRGKKEGTIRGGAEERGGEVTSNSLEKEL